MTVQMGFEPFSILLVDDEVVVRGLVKAMLEKLGFAQVDEAADGSAALRKLDQNSYSLILCDVHMEPIGGIDFLKALRQGANVRYSPSKSRTPVIFLSGSADTDDLYKARQLGVQSYILKPVVFDALKKRLSKILKV